MIKLGSRVRDTLTGFEGIATGRTEYLYGCIRILIEPAELKDGKPVEALWFDDQRVAVIVEDGPKVSADSVATAGGPQNDPIINRSRP
jgi:hypothetical protein